MTKLIAAAFGATLFTTTAFAGPTITQGQQIIVTAASVTGSTVTLSAPVSGTTTAGPIFLETNFGNLLVWCMDLYHDIVTVGGQNLHYVAGAVSTNYAPSNSALTPFQIQEIEGLAVFGTDLYNSGTATMDQLAGVQLAIWSIESPDLSYTGADASITNADLALAPSLTAPSGGLIALDGTQSFVAAEVSVPEPVSIAMLTSALIGLTFLRRRR